VVLVAARQFKTFSAFSSHLNRKHPTISIVSPDQNQSSCIITSELEARLSQNDLPDLSSVNVNDTIPMLDTDELESNESVTLAGGSKRMAALFLLTMKEKHRLTQSSINFAVTQVTDMFKFIAADIKSSVEGKLKESLNEAGVSLPDLAECFNVNPFDGLMSEHMQTKFYRENFYLVVSQMNNYNSHNDIMICNFNDCMLMPTIID
jgi:hypothetical protein